MKKRQHDPAQLDLLEWAAKRPTAEIIKWIPHLARRMWAERGQPIAHHDAKIMPMAPAPVRRRA